MSSKRRSDLPAVEITTDEAGLLHLAAATDVSVVVSAAGAGGRAISLFDSHRKTVGIAAADSELVVWIEDGSSCG